MPIARHVHIIADFGNDVNHNMIIGYPMLPVAAVGLAQ
jgi:hypothetical protein